MDNRPLKWEEFVDRIGQTVYLSATPGKYELGRATGVVEQIIRPTGLIDPKIVVKQTKARSTTCSARSASGPRRTSGSWSRR